MPTRAVGVLLGSAATVRIRTPRVRSRGATDRSENSNKRINRSSRSEPMIEEPQLDSEALGHSPEKYRLLSKTNQSSARKAMKSTSRLSRGAVVTAGGFVLLLVCAALYPVACARLEASPLDKLRAWGC